MAGRQDLIADAKKIDIASRIKQVLQETEVKRQQTKTAIKRIEKERAAANEVPTLDPLMRQFEDALARGDEPMVDLIRDQITHFTGVRR